MVIIQFRSAGNEERLLVLMLVPLTSVTERSCHTLDVRVTPTGPTLLNSTTISDDHRW